LLLSCFRRIVSFYWYIKSYFIFQNISKIGKFRRRGKSYSKAKVVNYDKNDEIRSLKLLVIDEKGNKLGILDKAKALALAELAELDLVEVSPNSKPPVARILSWSKFKYQQIKKQKVSKAKRLEQKEMWFKVFIEKKDLEHKINKIKAFLKKKHPVKITIKAKGRVKKDLLSSLMKKIIKMLQDQIDYDGVPKHEGRNISLIVRPSKSKKNINKKQNEKKKNQNSQSNSKKIQAVSK